MTFPNVERSYVDMRYGQSHLYRAQPEIESSHRPLVCFHMSPWAAVTLEPLVSQIGVDRLAVAIDTPGYGNSDSTPQPPTMQNYAAAMGDVIDQLGLDQIDVLGERTGAKLALELARQRPNQVRRIVLVSPVVWTQEEKAIRRVYSPEKVYADGSHLTSSWNISSSLSMPGRTLDHIARVFHARLLQNPIAHWGRRAAGSYDASDTLKKLVVPIMVMRPKDELWSYAPRVQPYLQHSSSHIVDLPDWGLGFLDVVAEEAAGVIRNFLDMSTAGES